MKTTRSAITLALALCLAIAASANADSVGGMTIDFVDITSDASSANGTDWGTSGDKFTDPGVFRMGKFEVTNAQWDTFVTAMGAPTGSPATAFDMPPTASGPAKPVNNVSFLEAVQFVNYLNTSTGNPAAYNVVGGVFNVWSAGEASGSNLYRHKGAMYFLPTLHQVLKAAYWNGTTFQTYANATDTLPAPSDSCFSTSGGLWDVGSGAVELNGTYDMMGNMGELQENDVSFEYPAASSMHRWGPGASIVSSSFGAFAGWTGFNGNESSEYTFVGLRVASAAAGDFDSDGDIDGDDIDLMGDAIRLGSAVDRYDLNGDSSVDVSDLDFLVRSLVGTSAVDGSGDPIFGTEYGDFNLDGEIELGDLTRLGTYYGVGDKWAEGNANRYLDLDIELGDLTILGTYYGASNGGDAIPEPMTLSIMVCGAIGLIRRRRRA